VSIVRETLSFITATLKLFKKPGYVISDEPKTSLKSPGVYMFIAPSGVIEYVGMSKNLKRRVTAKHKNYLAGDLILLIPVEDIDLVDRLEKVFINAFWPERNKKFNKGRWKGR
jgi:hypothetical protein